mgnify:CR=1 FL=1|jgi:hypothetical protein
MPGKHYGKGSGYVKSKKAKKGKMKKPKVVRR